MTTHRRLQHPKTTQSATTHAKASRRSEDRIVKRALQHMDAALDDFFSPEKSLARVKALFAEVEAEDGQGAVLREEWECVA